ncbi:MAG: hypothetical protein M0R17_08505 [Candidatus Omnitrophica bacterium]|jgi:hypothetical protein|nr:hypothetical protein [Candidatus Omnitrophota bacterium]
MKTIIIWNEKPIYVAEKDNIIDYYLVVVTLFKILGLNKPDIDEWRSNCTVLGATIPQIFKEYGIEEWKWNELENDWVLQTK